MRKQAGVEGEENEWECLTTDYRGYPMAIKRSKLEGFNDQHVIPPYLFTDYIMTAEQKAYIERRCKKLKEDAAMLF